VADSTAARIAVLCTGAVFAIQYLRNQKKPLDRGPRPPAHAPEHREVCHVADDAPQLRSGLPNEDVRITGPMRQ
jgi:hypothetical protein